MRITTGAVALFITALLAACDKDPSPGVETPRASELTAARTDLVDVASIERALRNAGVDVSRDPTPIQQSFMSVRATRLVVDGADLQVYIYPSVSARRADTDRLDAAGVSPATVSVLWVAPPSLITFNNVALILLTADSGLRGRITAALSAS